MFWLDTTITVLPNNCISTVCVGGFYCKLLDGGWWIILLQAFTIREPVAWNDYDILKKNSCI